MKRKSEQREIDSVEWLDENLMGLRAYWDEHDRIMIQVHLSGSVLLDDTEYVFNEDVEIPVEKCTLPKEKP